MAGKSSPRIKRKSLGLGDWLRNSFFAGIVVVTPIAMTALLMITLVNFVDNRVEQFVAWISNLIPNVDLTQYTEAFFVPGIGVLLAIVAITILGVLARNFFGRFIIRLGEQILDRVPLVRSIYGPIKQILVTIFRDQGDSFKEVALVEYPKEGIWAMCFVTATAKGAIDVSLRQHTDEEHVAVFLPTTPNPTSGFLLYVPRSKLRKLDMSVEDGARAIISFGIVTSKDEEPPIPKVAGKRGKGRTSADPLSDGADFSAAINAGPAPLDAVNLSPEAVSPTPLPGPVTGPTDLVASPSPQQPAGGDGVEQVQKNP